MIVFASDLDNTLLYSTGKVDIGAVCVEWRDGRERTCMTPLAFELLPELASRLLFVPVTTRSLAQYSRIRFPLNDPPPYALVSNGGILLRGGKADSPWLRESKRIIAAALPQLRAAEAILAADRNICLPPRMVDELFLFAKTSDPAASKAKLEARLDPGAVCVGSLGNKIYILPAALNKGVALRRLRALLGNLYIFAAGDSDLDIPMLREADFAIIPQELAAHPALSDKTSSYTASCKKRCAFGDEALRYISGKVRRRTDKQAVWPWPCAKTHAAAREKYRLQPHTD